jgi:hypothetical protein
MRLYRLLRGGGRNRWGVGVALGAATALLPAVAAAVPAITASPTGSRSRQTDRLGDAGRGQLDTSGQLSTRV